MHLLMRLIDDRVCLELSVSDEEAIVVDRAPVEGYMYGLAALSLPGAIPGPMRYFSRRTAESAMWHTRTSVSRTERWSRYLLPKVVVVATLEPERVRIAKQQPYLLDPRWLSDETLERADDFMLGNFPAIWAQLRGAPSDG
jgi:hypothetical protein